jgi:hypothetical protein
MPFFWGINGKISSAEPLIGCGLLPKHHTRSNEFVARGLVVEIRWDEKAGLQTGCCRLQVIDVLEAQEIKETGNEEG